MIMEEVVKGDDGPEPIRLASGGGCIYREPRSTLPCRKLCDPGETMCPYHRMLSNAKENEARAMVEAKLRTPRGYRE